MKQLNLDLPSRHYDVINVELITFQRNGSSSGVLRAKTGIVDIHDLGQIISSNGEEKLKFWKGEKCNAIK